MRFSKVHKIIKSLHQPRTETLTQAWTGSTAVEDREWQQLLRNTVFSVALFLSKTVLTVSSGFMALFLYGRVIQKITSSPSTSRSNQARNKVLAISFRIICILFLAIQLTHSSVELGLKIAQYHFMPHCISKTDDRRCNLELYAVVEIIEIANNCLWLIFGVANSVVFIVLIRPLQQPLLEAAKFFRRIAKAIYTRYIWSK